MSQTAVFAQDCLPGGITFTNQAQIDNFPKNYPGCTEIVGRVTISGSDITNLNGLSQLTYLWSGLYIFKNNTLTSLQGLHNVTRVYSLHIGEYHEGGNPLLTSLSGLEALALISDDLEIYDNNSLTSLTGLDKLAFVGRYITISKNELLSSITGLKNLTTAGRGISIGNSALTSLDGLEKLVDVRGALNIWNNPFLTNISGLSNVKIDSITDLIIYDNPVLATCELPNLCQYLSNPNGIVMIYNNATGCDNPTEMAHGCGITLGCLPYGDYFFLSQSDINNFRTNYPDCTDLGGRVHIKGKDITNLDGLKRVKSVDKDLNIDSCTMLDNLSGLDSLVSIGNSLYISYNNVLTSLKGLDHLTSVGWGIGIEYNPALKNLSGMEKLSSVGGGLNINDNNSLTSLSGLGNISSANWLLIISNPRLESISALKSLTSVDGELWIINNYALGSLSGLDNITLAGDGMFWISGNTILGSLDGLKKLTTIKGSLDIDYNPALKNLSGLDNLTSIGFDLWIFDNDSLTSFNGLENLTSIGRSFWIIENKNLANISGIKNIDAASISELYISDNALLSACEVKSICHYLAKPNSVVTIEANKPGCNSPEEVISSCAPVGELNISANNFCTISPNPSYGYFSINFTLKDAAHVKLVVLNSLGQAVEILVNDQLMPGLNQVTWDAIGLPSGMYYYRMLAGDQTSTGKVILMK